MTTVESPNNGHIGDWTFVRCRDVRFSVIAYPLEARISIQSVPRGLSVVGGCPLLGMPVLGDFTVFIVIYQIC